MPNHTQLLYDIEIHSVAGIRRYFDDGGSPNDVYNEVPVFIALLEMYTRSPRFKDCVQIFIDAGLVFEYKALLAVLTDDAEKLKPSLETDPVLVINKTYSLVNNTYTSLTGGTLLHFCAEYNSVACAGLLVQYGADVNAKAGLDEHGFGGHTPIFHTVNQNGNNSVDMLHFLLENKADLTHTVKGLIWGKGYEWETFIPAVNPISYAMMGLLPQMHRKEKTITEVVSLLMKRSYGIEYTPANVPNAYLGH
ncbi:Ankyrin repeat-containing protein [Mucilaginibacter sp. OK268]|uniref:ankyrin repeat domain-containing protein n=1 Tax=Mucilaginibacter sp. OK268 TaxID=1881048 RepID=UPI000889F9A3|nr:ankyrin repeat domain-containing protein [Mucilaginibacter sp. OK268]SDP95010.1 Ankyrin repeat-containing protein [Mucilaginibacter sp. OK268]